MAARKPFLSPAPAHPELDRLRAETRSLKVTDEQVAVIRKMHQERFPISAIARATGLSRPTVYAVLKDDGRA